MGHPKFQRKKYFKPSHPWNKATIEQEKELKKEFGLKNKKEIWKANSYLKKLKTQAKRLIRSDSLQAKKEEELFRKRLLKYDLLPTGFKLEDVLALQTRDILNLRLQTQVFKQGFARTVNQARQFITHGHIFVNNKKVAVPSYLVLKTDKISFSSKSSLSNSEHPERPKKVLEIKTQLKLQKETKKEKKIKGKKEKKTKETKKEKKQEQIKEKNIKKEKIKETKKVPTAHELAEKKSKKNKK